jgi:hypothetical protein
MNRRILKHKGLKENLMLLPSGGGGMDFGRR